jgi:hypothetical protein
VRGSINLCDVALPTFDVDNEEMLKRLTADNCSLFRRLREAPRHYNDNHEKELEESAKLLYEFVENNPQLFISNREIDIPEWDRMLNFILTENYNSDRGLPFPLSMSRIDFLIFRTSILSSSISSVSSSARLSFLEQKLRLI